ncbi:pyridoxal kinase [Paracoccus aminophilus]|uniref:pyridoxal kinase n=1 Tax=Paracoccus aminophilus JCM 7686 TaxID=1367847 RepID=S5YYS1_PARAH|nr:pyridoxal kinase [Paracoccus aminophilus]AGT10371.1 pyridoxal kinase [Paracoccus aminophilus JCM 7686]
MKHAKLVISIQSQVVFGHVGNSAAVFPMQAVGLEVAPVPTVLLSNTPNHPTIRGRSLPPELFADLLLGIEERGLMEAADFIVTGYFGSAEVAGLAADFIARAKARNPDLTYLCDPVMGDTGPGLYVPEAIAAIFRDRLMPMADLATPNQFELGYLGGTAVTRLADLEGIGARLGLSPQAQIICTGCVLEETPEGQIESLLVSGGAISRHPCEKLPVAKSGTGDLFAGLVISGLGRGKSLPEAVDFAQRLTARAIGDATRHETKEVLLSDADFRRALLLD